MAGGGIIRSGVCRNAPQGGCGREANFAEESLNGSDMVAEASWGWRQCCCVDSL